MDYDDPRRMYPINISDGSHSVMSHLNTGSQPLHIQTNHHAALQTEHPRIMVGSILDGSVVTLPQITGGGHQFHQQIQHTLLHAPPQQTHHHHLQQLQCQTTSIATQPIQNLQTTIHQLQSNNIIENQNIDSQPTNNHLHQRTMTLPTENVMAEVVDVIGMSSIQNANNSKCLICNEYFDADKNPQILNLNETMMTSTCRSLRELLILTVGETLYQSLGNEMCSRCFYDFEKIDTLQQNLLNAKLDIINMCRNTLQNSKPNEEIPIVLPQIERLQSLIEEQCVEDELPSDIEMKDDPNDPDVTLASLKQTKKKRINTKNKLSINEKKKYSTIKKRRGRPKNTEKESDEIPEGEEALNCPCCQKIIRATRYLKHIINVHKVFQCPFCSNIFRQRDIKHHVAGEHQDEIKFPCSSCNLAFNTFSSLKRHCIEIHCGKIKERSKCDLCSKTFSGSGALKVHLETIHDNSQTVKCPVCKESFNQRGNMRNHFRRVHEGNQVKKLQCSACGKGFVCPSELRKHVEKVHLKLKKTEAVCQMCSKTFAEERSLKVHINAVHTKEVKYPCSECKMVFNSLTNMLTHKRRMHAGIEGRKHICNVCSKGFCSPSDLRTHIKVVHENVRKFVCDLCGQRFKVGSHLKYHRRRHTGEAPYKCPHCTKCFHGPSHISDHVKKVHRTVYMGINQRRKLNLPDDAPPPPPGILPSKDSKGTIILTTEPSEPQVTQIIIPEQNQQHMNTTSMQQLLPFGTTNMITGPAMMDPQNHYTNLDQANHSSSSLPMVIRLLHDVSY